MTDVLDAPAPDPAALPRATRRENAIALCGYALLAIAATWPLALDFAGAVPGLLRWQGHALHPESLGNLWNLWWFRFALVELGQSPFDANTLFYPEGVDLWQHTFAPLYGVVATALQAVVSLTAAQNIIILLDLVAAGACAGALGRRLGLSAAGAFVAGAIYALCPPLFAHLVVGHVNLLATFVLPASLFLFLSLTEPDTPRRRDALALGALLGATAYASPTLVLYAVELLALVAVARRRSLARPRSAGCLVAAAAIALAIASPLVSAHLLDSGVVASAVDPADFDRHAGDLLGLFVPSFAHPLFGDRVLAFYEAGEWSLPQESTLFLGVSVLGLAVLGWRCSAEIRAWRALLAGIAVVFWGLALGAHLEVGGFDTGIPLPMRVLGQLPFFELARAPGRHILVSALGVALLAGAGFCCLRAPALRVAALAAVSFELAAVPIPLVSTDAAPVYDEIAKIPGRFAVLDLPLQVRDGHRVWGARTSKAMLGQTVHHQPIVGGAVARLPAPTWERIRAAPLISSLLDGGPSSPRARARDARDGPAYFARYDIRAIVVHPRAREGVAHRTVEKLLPVERRRAFPDGTLLLWLAGATPTDAP